MPVKATDNTVEDPIQIDAVPLMAAVGKGFTVNVLLAKVDPQSPPVVVSVKITGPVYNGVGV